MALKERCKASARLERRSTIHASLAGVAAASNASRLLLVILWDERGGMAGILLVMLVGGLCSSLFMKTRSILAPDEVLLPVAHAG